MNRQILLMEYPKGVPTEGTFQLVETSVPSLEEGQLLVKTLYLSVDPYMRSRMSTAKSYVEPFELYKVLQGGVVGEVMESKNGKFAAGDVVVGMLGWQDYSVSDGKALHKINPDLAPISTALHVVGMTGMTAYFGLLDIGKPQAGETVVVSGAAGAVGSTVGQIAKIYGCHVVGIAGGREKCSYLTDELGFDAAIDYKETENLLKSLREACPNGVDVYFDNVGGDITDAVILHLNQFARIPICGQISAYNATEIDKGPRNFVHLLKTSSLAKGFIVNDYAHRTKEAMTQLGQWVLEGRIKYRESIVEGLENAPQAFLGLFSGENTGKMLVQVAERTRSRT